ncbi:alpha-2-macroglobulin-like protein 1 isoform X2 [Podarcis raffonei]|uniref:alpha-2-macroglobulin-like protein 1 isoform X2 n=1 Tax=Podarcis raffonei TaxID=65483 RepID=UPI00232930D2|nr:alpha-2-macroglobulin-like protein 1 isoform X2 [Podarcis raffonei]
MGAAMFLWALALLSLTAPVISDPHYLLTFPAVIHHPDTEEFCVLLSNLPETVHLKITLEMTLQNHTLLEKDVEKPGTHECTSFQVPAFVARKTESYYIPLEGEMARVHILVLQGDSVSFKGSKKVQVKSSPTINLMDLDKPFYKPGERVKLRIVQLDDRFKARNKSIPLLELRDPNGNRIGQWVDVKPHHGIVDLSFPLASEAALGSYTFKMGEDYRNRKVFTVEEYVLPKFEVLFELPQLVTRADEEVQVKVLGRYTYGKLVRGKVDLHVTRDVSFYFFYDTPVRQLDAIQMHYTGQTDKNGYVSFTINATDLKLPERGYTDFVQLSAEFEEEGTGVKVAGTGSFSVVARVASVQFLNLNPFYKHGFPYTGKMKCTINDAPFKNETVYLTVDINDVETNIPYRTDENGEVAFSLDTTEWKDTPVSLRGRYTILKQPGAISFDFLETIRNEAFVWLMPFYSESNSFLEIQHVEEELPCGKDQEVLVDYILDRKELGPEADHVDFYYLVVSKGKIAFSGKKQVPIGQDETLKGTFSLTLSTSSDLAPTVRLLLYAVFLDGEVAADVDNFRIEKCFKHKVTLGFSETEELPGAKVNLQIEAAPGALCSLRAVDKSVALKGNGTLTPEEVYQHIESSLIGSRGFYFDLEDFEPYPCLPSEGPKTKRSIMAPWFQTQADAYSLFKQLNMKVITNTKIKKPVSCGLPERTPVLYSLGIGVGGMAPGAPNVASRSEVVPEAFSSVPGKAEEAKPRTYFPETWVWTLVPVNEEGKATYPVTAPDTITEWNADAFCVADIGFGLARQAKFRVFQPFFVDMSLPYSVVRGETLLLKSTVFNYMKECIQVRVNLLESQEVDVKPCPACQFSTCLCAEEAHTFSWNVTATQLGHVNLSVTAEAEEKHELCGNKISTTPARGRSDTVVKSLLVKPEGVLEEETHNAFLCSSGDPVHDEVSLKLPEAVVEGSGRATVSCIGDIMGAALENIDQLLQMPFGCGEQNMVKFVPNIFILHYLEKTNQVTPEIKEKAIEYMKSGYQRELLYKHDDGSYSAFGKSDAEGNTWLTAFVVKALGHANAYISIDEKHIQEAVGWLGKHQLPNGCFESVGRLFNNALKGGVDDDFSLTAYIAASLLELGKNDTMVENALACLKKNLTSAESSYSKALLAYVFTLAGDTEIRHQLLTTLDEHAEKTDGAISLSDVETTAYFLLSYLSKPEVSTDEIKYASQIVRSLTKAQNPYGGFSSTQDTVVALQALPKYAALTYRETGDVKVLVKSSGGFRHEFHVDKQNRLVLQQAPLAEVPGQYKLEVSGDGCAYVQTTLRFNYSPEQTNVFALSVETSPKECNQVSRKFFDIHLQVSYTGQRKTSNMALIEVNLVSGFIPLKKSVKKLEGKANVKKVEFDPDKISIYLDQLDSTVQTYVFSVEQEIDVLDLKPAIVKVYDYYHPEDSAEVEYNAPCSTESTKKDHH